MYILVFGERNLLNSCIFLYEKQEKRNTKEKRGKIGEMNMVLKGLQPEGVFGYFEKISSIPRGSGNCKYIADFLLDFAKKNKLEYMKDEIGNIVIRKDATLGYENAPGIILQGHMDMVCVATEKRKIDFEKDGITLQTDGERIWAEQTSLGADDGIAIAYALEILASNTIPHPSMEVLFTVDEEIGLVGANAFNPKILRGSRMINLDSENEGIITISCAGGARAIGTIPIEWKIRDGICLQLQIQGLQGGHSGIEIQKNRVNANQLLGRVLTYLHEKCFYYLGKVEGGKKENAIPYEATAILYVKEEEKEKIQKEFQIFYNRIQKEFSITEPYVQINFTEEKGEEKMLTKETTEKIIFFLYHSPNGIITMNPTLTDMVQSSLNLGMLYMEQERIKIKYSIRSSVTSEKEEIKERLDAFFRYIGGTISFYAEYPAWEYREDSSLRDIAIKAYHAVYNDIPKVMSIHAGLECGIFVGKRPDLDCISFGPDITNAHTVKETIDVESVHRTWNFLLEILRRSRR